MIIHEMIVIRNPENRYIRENGFEGYDKKVSS